MDRIIPSSIVLVIVALGTLIAVSEVQKVLADEIHLGVKAGDWIRYDYTIEPPISPDLPSVKWGKIEFLSVEGPVATVRVTTHMSSGMEGNGTDTWNITKWGGVLGSIYGVIIPPNSQVGHTVFIFNYGNVTITNETTRTYLGVSRTVLYTSYVQPNGDIHYTYYWDKETGVVVEVESVGTGMGGNEQTATVKVSGTNLWQALFLGLPIDPILFYVLVVVVIAIVVGTIVFAVRRKKKPSEVATPTQPN